MISWIITGGGALWLKPFWQEHLKAWSESGQTQAEYCRQHQISAAAFGWWKRQLQGKPKSPMRSSDTKQSQHRRTPVEFVEMQCGPDLNTSDNPAIYEVLLSQGRVIRIDHRFDPKVLQRLIATVESSC
jgi:hypothetical protein